MIGILRGLFGSFVSHTICPMTSARGFPISDDLQGQASWDELKIEWAGPPDPSSM